MATIACQLRHESVTARGRESGSPWLLVEGPRDVRLEAAAAAVRRMLGEG
jgi:hypothetical protein